jgi:hypothetical protein
MTEFQDHLSEWAVLWGLVQGREATVDGATVLITPEPGTGIPEVVAAWPADDRGLMERRDGEEKRRVTLATADAPATRSRGLENGLTAVSDQVLLTASTAAIAEAYALPEDAQLASAPMGDFDVAEISVFDHPVCSGRISVGENAAVIGNLRAETPQDRDAYEPALLGALAEEAYLHGAHTLFLIIEPGESERFVGAGWTEAGHLLSFERA